jgi:hypothetical protein
MGEDGRLLKRIRAVLAQFSAVFVQHQEGMLPENGERQD